MGTAYQHLSTVLGSLAKVDDAFQDAKKQLSKIPNTEATYFFAHIGDFNVAGTSDTGTSWEIEIAAMRDGTESRWKLEIELMHSSQSCELSAEAGFQGKYGPMPLREITAIRLDDLGDLDARLGDLTKELFQDLEGDCCAAVEADREEMKSFVAARGDAKSEQDDAPKP